MSGVDEPASAGTPSAEHFLRGQAAESEGRSREAIGHYRECLRSGPAPDLEHRAQTRIGILRSQLAAEKAGAAAAAASPRVAGSASSSLAPDAAPAARRRRVTAPAARDLNPVDRWLARPAIERHRVWLPVPVVLTLLSAVLAPPFCFLNAAARSSGSPLVSSVPDRLGSQTLALTVICTAIIGGLSTLVALLARLSGYRHFRWRSAAASEVETRALAERLDDVAGELGLHVVWRNERNDFVAVRHARASVSDPRARPGETAVRASFLTSGAGPGRRRGRLMLQIYGFVVWDTGERRALERLGTTMLVRAGAIPSPGAAPRDAPRDAP
ncbi:MAG: hypothetical protein U0610_12495 [bacterium]